MPYKVDSWKNRIASRADMTSQVVHLTRGIGENGKDLDAVDVLLKILNECRLEGSSQSGYICGNQKAVCFQDTPLYSLGQNIYLEEQWAKNRTDQKIRYMGLGLMLPKQYVYRKGGRPVIYDRTEEAKKYLSREQWWRIVNFDLSNDESICDWTHEREWRVPGDMTFDLEEVTVVVSGPRAYQLFFHRCILRDKNPEILTRIKGFVSLGSVFY